MIYRQVGDSGVGLSLVGLGGHEYLSNGKSRGFNEDRGDAVLPGYTGAGYGGERRRELLSIAFDNGVNFFDVTIDPEKAAFVGEVARTRVGPANPFLAYGTMLPSPAVEAPLADLDYFFYNVHNGPTFEERGTMTVPSALATAWQYQERVAWLVANLLPRQQAVRVDGKSIILPPRRIVMVEL